MRHQRSGHRQVRSTTFGDVTVHIDENRLLRTRVLRLLASQHIRKQTYRLDIYHPSGCPRRSPP